MRRMTGLCLWVTLACSFLLGLVLAGGSPGNAPAETAPSPAPAGDNVSARPTEKFAREGILV